MIGCTTSIKIERRQEMFMQQNDLLHCCFCKVIHMWKLLGNNPLIFF